MEHLFEVGRHKAYQTLADALTAAQAYRAAQPACTAAHPVRIVLSGGRYPILAPLAITQSNLTICAAPGEEVLLTGSMPLEHATWQQSTQNPAIYYTQLAAGLAVDGFFVDDMPQVLARYPNAQENALPLGGVVDAAALKARASRWKTPETGYLRALHHMGWGGNDYLITGKDENSETGLSLHWVGDNNRGEGYKVDSLMVEGILEELDAPHEWFYCAASGKLFYCPPAGFDVTAPHQFEVALCAELFTIGGSNVENPTQNITLENITLQNTKRSLFQAKWGGAPYQPLLRGDWAVAPTGAITIENAQNVTINRCNFYNIGGNALFLHGYNEGHQITENHFCHLGACGIQVVGKPCAVDDPSFWPHAHYPTVQVHATTVKHPTQIGPITEDYPRDITIAENYIYDIGQYEKQSSGVNLSIASRIRILHNTIHKSARSNININDGSFGGHEIAYNDIFDAQRETTDHGPFNAWGRDRFWSVPSYNAIGKAGEKIRHYSNDGQHFYDTALLDAYQTTQIHHNRFHHAKGAPHTWGIDLDDGASNYEIYQNLCLGLGIKLREGFARKVWGNIIIDGKLEIHVSYAKAGDEITRNLIVNSQPWNFIAVDADRFAAAEYKVEKNWYYTLGQGLQLPPWFAQGGANAIDGDRCPTASEHTAAPCDALTSASALWNVDPQFANPNQNDYTPTHAAALQQIGFAPFAMQFGAAMAQTLPEGSAPCYPLTADSSAQSFTYQWQGAEVCDINDAIISATASAGYAGAYIITARGQAAAHGLRKHDIVKALNGQTVKDAYDFVSRIKQLAQQTPSEGVTLTLHREGATHRICLHLAE